LTELLIYFSFEINTYLMSPSILTEHTESKAKSLISKAKSTKNKKEGINRTIFDI